MAERSAGDGSGDERPSATPPATVRATVEVRTHGDKYSIKDLLVDVSIFTWGANNDRMLFSSHSEKAKVPPQGAVRRPLANRRQRGGRTSISTVAAAAAARSSNDEAGRKEQSQAWVTGLPYYFVIEADSGPPLIIKGFTAPPRAGWPAQLKVSLHEKLAAARGIASGVSVQISPVPRAAWQQYVVDHVELTVVDAFISRSDLWGAVHSLRHSTMYVGKRVSLAGKNPGGTLATVKAMLTPQQNETLLGEEVSATDTAGAEGSNSPPLPGVSASSPQVAGDDGEGSGSHLAYKQVQSGIIMDSTKLTVRSLSGRIMLLFQLSREMFMYGTEDEGDTYYSRAVDMLIPELVTKWKQARCSHTVSLVLFARLDTTQDTDRDYFRPVWQGSSGHPDWDKVPQLLKFAVNSMILDMRATTPLHPTSQDLGSEGVSLSSARNGNTVEAVNLALNSLARHHIDRSLNTTGQAIIIITAGTGLIRTSRELSLLTSQRVLDTGAGCDLICLGRPPLHVSPVLEYCSGKSPAGFVYERPAWISSRFYCKRLSTIGTAECELLTYNAAAKQFQMVRQTFTPQCRMTSIRDRKEQQPTGWFRNRRAFGATPLGTPQLFHNTGFSTTRTTCFGNTSSSRFHSRRMPLAGTEGSSVVSSVFDDPHQVTQARLLPEAGHKLDQLAFKVEGEPIQWAAGEDEEPRDLFSVRVPDSPRGPERWSPSKSMRHHARVSSTVSDFEDYRGFDNHLERSRNSIGHNVAIIGPGGAVAWSPQSPSHAPLDRPCSGRVHAVSPTKQISGDDYLQRRSRRAQGPRPVLISPFDTDGCRSLDATHPSFIQARVAQANGPFEQANAARWSHLFPVEGSDTTGMHGTPNSFTWKFIVELALLPLTSPYYPVSDSDHMIPGFEIHHSTKTPSSTGVIPVPDGSAGLRTFLHECIVQRLHQGYQFIPPTVGATYRLSIGHQFHEISAVSQYCFQQWVHQEHRCRQPVAEVGGGPRIRPSPPSPATFTKSTTSPALQPLYSNQRLSASITRSIDGFDCEQTSSSKQDEFFGLQSPSTEVAQEFSYYLYNPFSRGWDCRVIKFHNESGNVYLNWSGLDQLLSGTQDEADMDCKDGLIDPLFMARKVKYAIVPRGGSSSSGFKEGVKRWLDQICSGSNFVLRQTRKLDLVRFEDQSEFETDFSEDLQYEPPPPQPGCGSGMIELVLEAHNCRTGAAQPADDDSNSTYQADEAMLTPSVRPANACPQPNTTARAPWFVLAVPMSAHPRCHLSFSITWLACPGYQISEFVDLCRRRMLQTIGQDYNLVQIPCATLTSVDQVSEVEERGIPMSPHIALDVSRCKLRATVSYLIENCQYVPNGPTLTYGSVLMHASGEAIVFFPHDDPFSHRSDDTVSIYFVQNALAQSTPQSRVHERFDVFKKALEVVSTAYDLVQGIVARVAPPPPPAEPTTPLQPTDDLGQVMAEANT